MVEREQPVFAESTSGQWFWWLPSRLPPEARVTSGRGGRVPTQAKGPFRSLEEAQDHCIQSLK
jgi:hypothetical protein